MSNAHDIIAKSTELGKLTRSFISSLDEFTDNIDGEISKIDGAVSTAGTNGWSGELYDAFSETMSARLGELRSLSRRAVSISERLEECAATYDQIVEFYRRAGG